MQLLQVLMGRNLRAVDPTDVLSVIPAVPFVNVPSLLWNHNAETALNGRARSSGLGQAGDPKGVDVDVVIRTPGTGHQDSLAGTYLRCTMIRPFLPNQAWNDLAASLIRLSINGHSGSAR